MDTPEVWKHQLEQLLSEMAEQINLPKGGLFVIGCSTSEVAGKHIGTAGAFEIGEALYEPLNNFAKKYELFLAFQGCEHINRALTIERQAAETIRGYNVDLRQLQAYLSDLKNGPVYVDEIMEEDMKQFPQSFVHQGLKSAS